MLQLQAVVALDHSKFGAGLSSLSAQVANASNAMMMAFGGVASEIVAMGRAFGPVGSAIAVLKQSITVGAGFEQQMANVASVSGLVGEELNKVGEAARDMAKTTRFTATEAADGLYALASAGVSGADALSDTLRPSLLLAGATLSDTSIATETMTTALAAFQIPASEATRVADQFAGAIASSPANMQRLADAMKYAGPAAAGFGVSLEQAVAEVAAFHQVGLRGEMAGTSFRMALVQLSQAASNTKTAIGQALEGWDASTESITGAVRRLNAAGIDTADVIQELGARAGPGLAALMKVGADSMDALSEKIAASADVAKMYETQMTTLSGKFAIFKSAAEEVFQTLFAALSPALQTLTDQATAAIDAFLKLTRAMLDGDWGTVRDMIMGVFAGARAAADSALTNFRDFAARAAAYFAAIDWAAAWTTFQTAAGQALTAAVDYLRSALASISDYFRAMDWAPVWEALKTGAINAFNFLRSVAFNAAAQVSAAIMGIDWRQLAVMAGEAAIAARDYLLDIFTSLLDGGYIADTFTTIGEVIGTTLRAAFNGISGWFEVAFTDLLSGNWASRAESLWKSIFVETLNSITGLFTGLLEGIFGKNVIENVVLGAQLMMLDIKQAIQAKIGGILDAFNELMAGIITKTSAGAARVAEVFGFEGMADKIRSKAGEFSAAFADGSSGMTLAAERTGLEIQQLESYLNDINKPLNQVKQPIEQAATALDKLAEGAQDSSEAIADMTTTAKATDAVAAVQPVAAAFEEVAESADAMAESTDKSKVGLTDVLGILGSFKDSKISAFDVSDFVTSMKLLKTGLEGLDLPEINLPNLAEMNIPRINQMQTSSFIQAIKQLSAGLAEIKLPDLSGLIGISTIKIPKLTSSAIKDLLKNLSELKNGLMEVDFGALGNIDINIKGKAGDSTSLLKEIRDMLKGAQGVVWA